MKRLWKWVAAIAAGIASVAVAILSFVQWRIARSRQSSLVGAAELAVKENAKLRRQRSRMVTAEAVQAYASEIAARQEALRRKAENDPSNLVDVIDSISEPDRE